MKKILSLSFVFILFILGVFLTPSHRADAAVTVSVSASPASVASGGQSTITWSSSGATSCYVSSPSGYSSAGTGTSGVFTTNVLYSTTTFYVKCTDGVVYFKLCPNTSGAGTYYTTGTAGSYYTGQQVTGAIWCNPFYEYTVCGSSSSSDTYINAGYGEISVTGSVC